MLNRPASWFRNVALGSALVAVAMVPTVPALVHGSLPLWLHIPLTGLALAAMGGGAAVTGVALAEYRARGVKPAE